MDDGCVREILRLVQRLPPLTREQFRAFTLSYRNDGHSAEAAVAERLYFVTIRASPLSIAKHKVRVIANAFGRELGFERHFDPKKH
jgi:hypothetical protein